MRELAADALMDVLNVAAGALGELDAESARKLARWQGRVVCVEVTRPVFTVTVLVTAGGVEVCRGVDAVADVTLRGSGVAFARLGRRVMRGDVEGEGRGRDLGVEVRGDVEFGRALQGILAELDLDWEEALSRRVGDTAARKTGNAVRGVAEWAEDTAALMRANVTDFLTEEQPEVGDAVRRAAGRARRWGKRWEEGAGESEGERASRREWSS